MMKRYHVSFWACWAAAALLYTSPVAAAGRAHEHGVVRLDVAVDGNKLSIELDAPLDSLLGFERAPRTDAEKRAAAAVLVQLRSPQPPFTPDAAAGCKWQSSEVLAPVLEAGADKAPSTKPKEVHADLTATFRYTCSQPQQLRVLDVGLFEAYARMQRIDAQVVGNAGQSKATLRRPQRVLKLAR
jgi:Protein of unknown function (DUF2796)